MYLPHSQLGSSSHIFLYDYFSGRNSHDTHHWLLIPLYRGVREVPCMYGLVCFRLTVIDILKILLVGLSSNIQQRCKTCFHSKQPSDSGILVFSIFPQRCRISGKTVWFTLSIAGRDVLFHSLLIMLDNLPSCLSERRLSKNKDFLV